MDSVQRLLRAVSRSKSRPKLTDAASGPNRLQNPRNTSHRLPCDHPPMQMQAAAAQSVQALHRAEQAPGGLVSSSSLPQQGRGGPASLPHPPLPPSARPLLARRRGGAGGQWALTEGRVEAQALISGWTWSLLRGAKACGGAAASRARGRAAALEGARRRLGKGLVRRAQGPLAADSRRGAGQAGVQAQPVGGLPRSESTA